MAVKHRFTSDKADGADTTLVRPSNWNDEHNHPPFEYTLIAEASTAQIWTNLGATPTEIGAPKTRHQVDLTHAVQARIVINQSAAGATGSWLRVQYSTDGGTNWAYLDGGTGPEVAFVTANQVRSSGWVNLAAGAKADVQLRPVAGGGDGAADPSVFKVMLQVR